MHINDSHLRAHADGELDQQASRDVQTHLAGCADCRQRLSALQADLSVLDESLELLAPGALDRSRPRDAFIRLNAQVHANNQPLTGGILMKLFNLSRNWRRATSGLAVVGVLALLMAFAPVRAAASAFLQVFRLERVVILSIDPAQIEEMANVANELGSDFFPGTIEYADQPPESYTTTDVADAAMRAGYDVATPAGYRPADAVTVNGATGATFVPDLGLMQVLFEAAGLSPDLVPPEIDGQEFSVTVPISVMQSWNMDEDYMSLIQMESPTFEFPESIDEAALGSAMLQLMGLPANEAESLAASIDWTTTLILPLPSEDITYEEVVVNGTVGWLFTSELEGDNHAGVLWSKDGMLYFLAGTQPSSELVGHANTVR